nr:unnamed protein product [Callosobruchus chinensis]
MSHENEPLSLPCFQLFENEAVEKYIDGIGIHWYADRLVSSSKLTQTYEAFPGKFMVSTEASLGFIPLLPHVVLGSWDRAERYAFDIMDDINNYVGGWVDWNMVLDTDGGPTYISNFLDSPIIVNATAGEFYKQPYFYVIGHFSKFVPRSSVRIEVAHSDKDLTVSAFRRPDNGTALVILNRLVLNSNIKCGTHVNKEVDDGGRKTKRRVEYHQDSVVTLPSSFKVICQIVAT